MQEATAVPNQATSHLGTIEQELLSSTPRKVRLSSKNIQSIGWATTIFSLLLFGSVAFWTILTASHAVLACVAFAIWLFYEYCRAFRDVVGKQYLLLKHGTATRAMILSSSVTPLTKNWRVEDQALEVTYQYETDDGKVRTSSFFLIRKRAWQLGISDGATFTVLYDHRRPEKGTPYFEITNAEIVGTMGAKLFTP